MKFLSQDSIVLQRLLWLGAKLVPILHIGLNFTVVLFLTFTQQSLLHQIIKKNASEAIAYYVFFGCSLMLFCISWLIEPGYLTDKVSKKIDESCRYNVVQAARYGLQPLSDNEETEDLQQKNRPPSVYFRSSTAPIQPAIGNNHNREISATATAADMLNMTDEERELDIANDDIDAEEDEDDYHSLQNGYDDFDESQPQALQAPPPPARLSGKFIGSQPGKNTLLDYEDDAAMSDASVEASSALLGSSTGTVVATKTSFVTQADSTKTNNSSTLKNSSKRWTRLTEDQESAMASMTMHLAADRDQEDLESVTSAAEVKNSCFGRRNGKNRRLEFPFGRLYCKTCALTKPLRAKHCDQCKHCIVKFDHHCPWLNNCIGERNHRYFVAFLLLQCIVIWWSFRYTLYSFKHGVDWYTWTRENGVYMVCFITLIMGGVPASGLLFFHLYLMFSGVTTWELVSRTHISYLRDLPTEANPFNKGCMHNCFAFCLLPYPVNWNQIYVSTTKDWLLKQQRRAQKMHNKKSLVSKRQASAAPVITSTSNQNNALVLRATNNHPLSPCAVYNKDKVWLVTTDGSENCKSREFEPLNNGGTTFKILQTTT